MIPVEDNTPVTTTPSVPLSWQQVRSLPWSQKKNMTTRENLLRWGRYGYLQAFPEVFGGMYGQNPNAIGFLSDAARLEAEINDLRYLSNQLGGTEATYMRWLIQKKIDEKWAERTKILGRTATTTPKELPMPDWLKPYLETAPVPTQQVMGRRTTMQQPAPALRPMGAQAEVNPEQQSQMAGYLAWRGAGAPTKFSESALIAMSDWSKWWEPYIKQSEELFPSQNRLRTNWATARQ